MTLYEKMVKMDEVVEGFVLMVSAVEALEELSEGEITEDTKVKGALVSVGLEMVTAKVNDLLGEFYANGYYAELDQIATEVKIATEGKEHYLAVAMMLTTGGAF